MRKVLIIHGKLDTLSNVLAFVDWFFKETNATPLYSSGATDRLGGFKRNRSKITLLENVEVRGSKSSSSIAQCDYYLAFESGRSGSIVAIVQFPTVHFQALDLLIENLQGLCCIDYCFVWTSPYFENAWYALGAVDAKLFGYGNEADDICKWDQDELRIHQCFSGRLRDIYHWNYVDSRFVELIADIKHWNLENSGALSESTKGRLFCFTAPTFGVREKLRVALRAKGKLICEHPFPGDGIDSSW